MHLAVCPIRYLLQIFWGSVARCIYVYTLYIPYRELLEEQVERVLNNYKGK